MKHMTRKATRHVNQNEGLIFEKSSPGKAAWKLPPLDVPEVDTAKLLGASERKDLGNMPEVSEIEIIRHFTRLSTWNYAIDLGMYPLGSCTMKYNPRVNEVVARLEGIANGHPYQPEKISQGALRIIKTLSECLIEITGMDAITLQPAAGAHGEITGLLMVRAYHESKGNPRKKILIPDSAHGTNPATAAMVGYAVENLKSNARGMVDVAALAAQMNEDVAALMLTNPNTLGVFEQEIHKIAEILHAKGGLLYMDGANMNALVGKVRPGDFGVDVMHLNLHKTFSTPHGGGGPGSGPVAMQESSRTILPTPVVDHEIRWHAGLRLQPSAVRGPRARLLRQLRNVRPRAGLHPGERSRRPAPDHRRRRAQRQLHPQRAGRRLRSALLHAQHARSRLQRQTAGEKRREDHGHRQAPDRLRLPSLHDSVSADRARRADDRAHRERIQGRDGSVHRGHEVDRGRSGRRSADRAGRAALHARLAPGRNRRRPQACAALETLETTTEDTEDTEETTGCPFTMRLMPSRKCTTLKLINKPKCLWLSLR